MKTLTFTICILLCSNFLFSQEIIDVAEQTIKVNAMKTEELYFGFAAGDQVVFNFSEANKKDLKEIEILEYPYNSKFAVFEKNEVENKAINITKTGVYRFRFYNDAKSSRECKIKIQRIPASEETELFNTNVIWHNQYDTAYYTEEEQNVLKQEYISQEIISLTKSAIDGSSEVFKENSRTVFPVQLPENTIEWYYRVSVFKNKEEETEIPFNLASEITSLINQAGGLKFGPEHLTQPGGEAYCDVYVMGSADAVRFEAGDDYKYSLIGSNQHIKSGITKVYGDFSRQLYLGVNNPNGVNVLLECVAIVSKEERRIATIEKMNVVSRAVPALNVDDNISWAH